MASAKSSPHDSSARSLKIVTPGQPIARDLRAIMEREYPDQRWLVPNLLAYECNLMAAAPKTGKSTLALALALKVARMTAEEAGTALPPTVLYISPDDTDEGGLKERANRLCDGFTPAMRRIEFWFDGVERMGAGLIEQMNGYLDSHPACVFIILDALFSILPTDDGGKITVSDHTAMRELCRLQERRGVSLMVLHHDNKNAAQPGDRSAKISGSRGLTAGVHSYTILQRPDDSPLVQFYRQPRRGRPVQTSFALDELSVDWEPNLVDPWEPADTEAEAEAEAEAYRAEQELQEKRKRPHVPGPIERRMLDCIDTGEDWTPKTLSDAAQVRYSTTKVYLRRMLARLQVELVCGGIYRKPRVTSVTFVTAAPDAGARHAESDTVTKVTVTDEDIPWPEYPGEDETVTPDWSPEPVPVEQATLNRRINPFTDGSMTRIAPNFGDACGACHGHMWRHKEDMGATLYYCGYCHPELSDTKKKGGRR